MADHDQDAFGRLLDRLYFSSLDPRDKGDKFERLMRSYLLTDPEWSSQFSEVWLWKDYPGRDGRPDTGIDLVAQAADTGELTAIQCKFVDPEHTVAKSHIDSFIAASSRKEFSRRLLVSTSTKWGKNAEESIRDLDPPLNRINLFDLEAAPIDWGQFSLDSPEQMVRTDGKKAPRPHQRDAIRATAEGFAHSDRGKMIMACGTGKTYTSLQIVEEQTPQNGTVLFLVPSIALLSQTLKEWKRDATENFRALAVCSDVKVGKNTDEDISTTDLIIPATTNPDRLLASNQLARDYQGRTVVFATYQSIDVIAEAQRKGFAPFDLTICDEAHRTTGATLSGKDESAFTKVHDSRFIRSSKRLYMTATPRVFDEATKSKADENSVVVASMDDEKLYGPEFYNLGFGEAVERDLLSDYKVLVLMVDEDAVNHQLQRLLTDEDGELSIDEVARIVGCWNGLATRGTNDPSAQTEAPDRPRPMKRAVAFSSSIKESQKVSAMFPAVSTRLAADIEGGLLCAADHVDGGMNVAVRNQKLSWLQEEPDEGECRILSNARCLSEGVDVPSLDAVLFLNPRNSQVDVVQSVGRVMRKAPGKDYGYIILPVGIPMGQTPEETLRDSKKYKVIWSVLNALRSHDDRFEAMINKIDLNERDDRLQIGGVGTGGGDDDDSSVTTGRQLTLDLEFPDAEEWRDAIYAKIVQKVGDREYWENWAGTIAEVAARHTARISALVSGQPSPGVAEQFDAFVKALRHNLNQSITKDDAVSMLSQHLITKPVFDALFEGYDFAANNPVSQAMQRMIDRLQGSNLDAETALLGKFYDSVARRAADITNPEGKQRIITELYENFFKQAFPKQASALGVVYTPVEIVDFIIRAVDELSKTHFGAGVTDQGVHVLDPFTGTGTFIVRLLQSGVISPHDLARKYASELHANELMLLAYYIAAINIEATYHGLAIDQVGHDVDHAVEAPYVPFEGIVLADTFQMSEAGDTLDTEIFTTNNHRATRQLDTDIRVIVGNPPYSAGQTSANDNNANVSYPTLDASIRDTYAAQGSGQLKRSLYDSYIRAIRWGTDRIGDRGILAYVTNGGYIDSNSADGLRKSLTEDFDHLYIYNLRGNQRTAGELSRKEGGKVFGSGSRATVAIMIGVKDPTHTGEIVLHYRDIGDYLTREDKLSIIRDSTVTSTRWETIIPNIKGEWINQSSDHYDTLPPLGDKKGDTGILPIFTTYSAGLKTNRDSWVYNFSNSLLENNINRLADSYNRDVETFQPSSSDGKQRLADARKHATYDDTRIKWTSGLFQRLSRQEKLPEFDPANIRVSMYRPFSKQFLYLDPSFIERPSSNLQLFPTSRHENIGILVSGAGETSDFGVLATDTVPNFHLLSSGQFFPRYSWERVEEDSSDLLSVVSRPDDEVIRGYRRLDNISDATLNRYQSALGPGITKDAIFSHVYALLHSKEYRKTFAAELKRQLARVPMPASAADFWAFAEAGEKLLALHIGYESAEPYPLREEHAVGEEDDPKFYRVQKLRWGGKGRSVDSTRLVYNENITLHGIPEEAHAYKLGSRSALEWLVDQYRVTTDKASGVVHDPNHWAVEQGEPRYIIDLVKKITTLSVETNRIVRGLPELSLE